MNFEMPENVAEIDAVPERFKDFYVEDGDGGFKLESPKALKSAHTNSKRERMEAVNALNEAQTKLERYKDVDVDEYTRLKTAAEKGTLTADQEARVATMEANFNKKADELSGELDFYKRAAETGTVDGPLKSILIEAGVIKEDLDLMAHYARPYIKTNRDGEKLAPIVVNEAGTQRWNEKNEPMTLFDLVNEMKVRHPNNFKGNDKSGPGGTQSQGSQVPVDGKFAGKKISELSDKEKVEYQDKYGAAAYQKRVVEEANENAAAQMRK